MGGDGGEGGSRLIRIVYDSVSLLPFGVAGLRELNRMVAVARECNARDAITGALRSDGTRFLQVLEGDARAVLATMERIQADPRHRGIRILEAAPLARRRFADWSMVLVTDAQVAVARRRDPHLMRVFPTAAEEAARSLRSVLDAQAA